MIKSFFKIAWRNLLRNKGLSFINIFGLAIGMAFALLIGLWIQFETSYNQFHVNKDRIGQVMKHTLFNNQKSSATAMPLPLYDELKQHYPEIKRITRVDGGGRDHSLVIGENKFKKKGVFADPDFLKMFSFPMVKGNINTVLSDPNSVILTETLAATLFGAADPIGKTIKLDNEFNVVVTGVMKDVPPNSTFNFDFLAPFEFRVLNLEAVRNAKTAWGNNFLYNMVELKEGASMDALSKKIAPLLKQKRKDGVQQSLFIHPLQYWHLRNEYKDWVNEGGRIEYVRLFGIIGSFILLIACINFMNLATARSEKRAKEVGIRKAIGSMRTQLVQQFLSESLLTAFLAFLLSLGLIQVLLPLLKDLGFENIHFNGYVVAAGLAVCVITGLLAGSYPAIYLSSFKPVKVLKGLVTQSRSTVSFRKVLVVSQFVISIALIACTVIIFQQIEHAKHRKTGYDPNNLITINATNDLNKSYAAYKQELLNTGLIASVARASSPMTGIYNTWSDFSWEGKDPGAVVSFDAIMTEWDYEKTVGLHIKEGRAFSPEYKTDSHAVVLNEAVLKVIGYKDPIGKTISLSNEQLTIIGVVEDVVMRDPFKPVTPTVIIFNTERINSIFIRPKTSADLQKTLAAIQPITERHNPSLPFEYKFVDEEFANKFRIENQVGKLSGIFAALAILISCLGLFGLAAFMAERRTKEIGIRKVLGASVANLWLLLSKEFVVLVSIACIIASPLAWWLMHDWLQKYDYRIDISAWIFAIAGTLALLIALFTVSTQAIKAALSNPVKSLRTE